MGASKVGNVVGFSTICYGSNNEKPVFLSSLSVVEQQLCLCINYIKKNYDEINSKLKMSNKIKWLPSSPKTIISICDSYTSYMLRGILTIHHLNLRFISLSFTHCKCTFITLLIIILRVGFSKRIKCH